MLENYDKDYLKRVLLKAAGVLLGILVVMYIGYQIWHKITTTVKYEPATPYTYTVKSTGEGYVIRNETVIASPGNGSVVPSVSYGEKVSAGAEVACLYSESGADVRQKLSAIDSQIELLSMAENNEGLTNRDVSKLDGETYDVITEIRRCAEQGKYAEAVSHKMNLINLVNRRNTAAGTVTDASSQIAELKKKRAELTSSLGELISKITSPRSGWYYPTTDGYESVFVPSKTDNMTYSEFMELIASPVAATVGDAGKIVTSPSWYFVCVLDRESLSGKEVGKKYTVCFVQNRGIRVEMKLERISHEEEEGIAVFSSDKMPEGFDFARLQSYELIEEEFTGFRIPKSAVRMIDGQMGVYVLTGEVVHFRKIEVITEYENTYIVVMNHDPDPVEETTENPDNDGVAQSPEWSESGRADESVPETVDTSPPQYKWLGLNENVITSGKGLSDGRVITNMN